MDRSPECGAIAHAPEEPRRPDHDRRSDFGPSIFGPYTRSLVLSSRLMRRYRTCPGDAAKYFRAETTSCRYIPVRLSCPDPLSGRTGCEASGNRAGAAPTLRRIAMASRRMATWAAAATSIALLCALPAIGWWLRAVPAGGVMPMPATPAPVCLLTAQHGWDLMLPSFDCSLLTFPGLPATDARKANRTRH